MVGRFIRLCAKSVPQDGDKKLGCCGDAADLLTSFFAYGTTFGVGVNVAAGYFKAIGLADVHAWGGARTDRPALRS
jgi:hypothetical protein